MTQFYLYIIIVYLHLLFNTFLQALRKMSKFCATCNNFVWVTKIATLFLCGFTHTIPISYNPNIFASTYARVASIVSRRHFNIFEFITFFCIHCNAISLKPFTVKATLVESTVIRRKSQSGNHSISFQFGVAWLTSALCPCDFLVWFLRNSVWF